MLYNSKRKRLCRHLLAGGALCLAGLSLFSCSDTYDYDDVQPSNLNTIYGYMQSGGELKRSYKVFLHLIDDLGQKEVLSRTGSKTLFIADDAAFDKWFASNDWGVTKYEDLSLAQKKLLLNSAMLDNPYSESMLSTAVGPTRGEVCRTTSSQSIYDSVPVLDVMSDIIPANEHWNTIRQRGGKIVLFADQTGAQPMVYFTPKFLANNNVAHSDVDFLYQNPSGTYQSGEIYVNHSKVLNSKFCKNGFVHEVDEVVTPLDNMSEIIRKDSRVSAFSSILERFAAPAYSGALTTNYNQNKFGDDLSLYVDSVFIKRYFSNRSAGSGYSEDSKVVFNVDKDGSGAGDEGGTLKYDPGWQTYVPAIFNDRDPMKEDLAVMLVPSDDAINHWWNEGDGDVIRRYYGTLDNTPKSTLEKLVNVNMLNSLVESVPSRFDKVLDDANEELGIKKEDVDDVIIGCNGVIYITNKVFAPKSYSSVLFPAVVDKGQLSVISVAIDSLDYDAYLNSMVSNYSFVIPTNTALLQYVDPVSYAKQDKIVYEFYLNPKASQKDPLCAQAYKCTIEEDGTITKGDKSGSELKGSSNSTIQNRIEDMLDNIIAIERYVPGKHYYRTKGNTFVKIEVVNGDTLVSGSFQTDYNTPITANQVYHMSNGETYVLDTPVMSTPKATSDILAEHPEFSEFYQVLSESGSITDIATGDGICAASRAVGSDHRGNLVTQNVVSNVTKYYAMLNAYHYTVYAPTNEAMEIAYGMGLPRPGDVSDLQEQILEGELTPEEQKEAEEKIAQLQSVMRDFVRYHIQSNSVYVDGGFKARSDYESLKPRLDFQIVDGDTIKKEGVYQMISGSPYRIDVREVNEGGLTLMDAYNKESGAGALTHVITTDGLYNLQGREYWLNGTKQESASSIEHSSSVVVHAVDRPLLYSADQFKYIPRQVVNDDSVKRRK